ncbi:MAG: amylosucrase [Reinekea sp.]
MIERLGVCPSLFLLEATFMSLYDPINYQIETALVRLEPKLRLCAPSACSEKKWEDFWQHFKHGFNRLYQCLSPLYTQHWDFYYHIETCAITAAKHWFSNHTNPSTIDVNWFESETCIGATGYVDLFATNILGLENQTSYLKELGITYLHLMPMFDIPSGDSDGGYAIKDYGKLNPSLGTMDQLQQVATKLRQNNIKLVLDFVFNHTSDQHDWAVKAKQGNKRFQNYFWVFNDQNEKKQYSENLRDIFPDKRKGCFTWCHEIQADIWTTFNSFQWDLNYQNPEVFTAMCSEMLKLVNAGAEVIRLDALAFTWKEPGTNCENLPKAHQLIQAFNAFMHIAAPSVLLKSEAIVAPDQVVEYISPHECPLSYNPNFMALLWESLATRQTKLLIEGTMRRTDLPSHTAWVNYLRCHDDIGWAFADQDAWNVGINPHDHRAFLNQFYTGKFPGSFAMGVPFQYNPDNGDCRISGTLASLVGIESNADANSSSNDIAVRRALLLHGIMLAFKGIPLIYLGDELATTNDFSYLDNPNHSDDSRWVHRVAFDKSRADKRNDTESLEGRLYQGLQHLIEIRTKHRAFGIGSIEIAHPVHERLFVFTRKYEAESILVIANVSEHQFEIDPKALGLSKAGVDLITNTAVLADANIAITPYQQLWISLTH